MSHATVSLALRNSSEVSPETRKRIQKLAEEMGYRKNALIANLFAQLRSERKVSFQSTLGLVALGRTFEELRPFPTYTIWMASCQKQAVAAGYNLDYFSTSEPSFTPARFLRILKARNIRGLLVMDPLWVGMEDLVKVWDYCATVVLGVRPTFPRLTFAANDHFYTTLHAVEELKKLGYRRPGLCLRSFIELGLGRRFSGGFRTGQLSLRPKDRIPVCEMDVDPQASFTSWMKRERPDVVLGLHEETITWLGAMGLRVPEDVGFVNLDGHSNPSWSGLDQNHEDLAHLAVNTLISKIHRNDYGVPRYQEGVYVTSTWVDGPTLRHHAESPAAEQPF